MSQKGFNKICRLPIWIFTITLALLPLLFAVNISFRKYSFALPGYEGQFVGFENYVRALSDPEFGNAFKVTGIIMILVIPAQIILGFVMASLLTQELRGTRFFTSLIILPMTIAPIVVGLIGRLLLVDRFGVISYYMELLGLIESQSLLGNPVTAMASIIILDIWHWTPYLALAFTAGMQALPVEPFEAIQLDGATGLQTFRYITLPLLRPVIATSVLLRSIDLFRIFDEILILTGGGPGTSTESIEMLTYKINFHNWNMGYGASIGILTFLIVLAVSLGVYSLMQRD